MLPDEDLRSVSSTPEMTDCWLHSISDTIRRLKSTNLTLILDFSTLDHRPTQEDPAQDGHSAWDKRFSDLANAVSAAIMDSCIQLQALFIYPPEHLRSLELELGYERLVMNNEYSHKVLSRKYNSHQNRFRYRYTFLTGWTIKDSVVEDIMGL